VPAPLIPANNPGQRQFLNGCGNFDRVGLDYSGDRTPPLVLDTFETTADHARALA